jgi:putative endonuclease
MRRWSFWRRIFGSYNERLAARHLRQLGYRLLAANLADRRGELDLIAWDRKTHTLVIVEVRSTMSKIPERAKLSVDKKKQRKIIATTQRFLHRWKLTNIAIRFDVIAITWDSLEENPVLEHITHAFDDS